MSLIRLVDILGRFSNKKYSAVVEEVPPWMPVLYSEEHYRLHLSGQLKTLLVSSVLVESCYGHDRSLQAGRGNKSFYIMKLIDHFIAERKIFLSNLKVRNEWHCMEGFQETLCIFVEHMEKLWKNCCCFVAWTSFCIGFRAC